jgi:hypothetical protein
MTITMLVKDGKKGAVSVGIPTVQHSQRTAEALTAQNTGTLSRADPLNVTSTTCYNMRKLSLFLMTIRETTAL